MLLCFPNDSSPFKVCLCILTYILVCTYESHLFLILIMLLFAVLYFKMECFADNSLSISDHHLVLAVIVGFNYMAMLPM